MAGDGIKVGGAGIDTLVNEMKCGLAKLEQRLETMKGDLRPYVEQWDGSARQAYSTAQRDWDTQIEECSCCSRTSARLSSAPRRTTSPASCATPNMWG